MTGIDLAKLPPGMRIEFDDPDALEDPRNVEMVREIIGRYRANPLLGFYPYPKQAAYLGARKPIKMFIGGERSGKTITCNADDVIQAVPAKFVPDHLLRYRIWDEPFYGRVITPDFGQSYAEILRSLMDLIPKEALWLGKWEAAFSEKKHVLNFAEGSFLEFMTQQQEVSQFGGTSRHRVRYDEEPKGIKGEEIREANVYRLAQYRGDECFGFSPVHGLGATGEDLWDERGPEVAKDVYVGDGLVIVVAEQSDNPYLDEQGIAEADAKVPERMRAARKSGQFVHGAGLVYEEFDRDIHVCPPLDREFVKGLEQVDCLDPGLNTAVLFAGYTSDDELFVYDELFRTDGDSLPEKVVLKIDGKREEWDLPRRPTRFLMDPAAAARSNRDGGKTTLEDLYRKAGLKSRPADNGVEAGIDEVKRRLVNVDRDGNPAPLIHIASNCTRLLWELGRYRKERNAEGELEVVKENDHACDCLRYIAMHRKQKKKRKSRIPTRNYIPGTALPASAYPNKRQSTPPMGRFS